MKATWLPSGENVGDHAFPGRAVRGTTVSLWSSYTGSSRSIFGFIHGYSDPAMTTQAAAAIVALRFHHLGLGGLTSSLGGPV
jgi:queuine/archaeosine tRNA-ribosyltransferase